MSLPKWLDDIIFEKLGGIYERSRSDMTVIDWNRGMILKYLGTYFPRSYAEAFCIFQHFLQSTRFLKGSKTTSLLDFGCGTGGEIIGIAAAIEKYRPEIPTLRVKPIDGNQFALNCFDEIREEFNNHNQLQIVGEPSAVRIDDFYDLSILDSIIEDTYDVVISFKAVCEFVTKQQFDNRNAYEYLSKFLIPRIKSTGVMLLVDVTTKNNISQEWLPDMMDAGLSASKARILGKNDGYNETFTVCHSRMHDDVSKVAWRLVGSSVA